MKIVTKDDFHVFFKLKKNLVKKEIKKVVDAKWDLLRLNKIDTKLIQ